MANSASSHYEGAWAVFRGRYDHAMDAKGRTSVPARFREVLSAQGETRLVVTTGLDTCLAVYPLQEWLAFEDRLAALPQFDPKVVMLKRIYVASAVECDVDSVGRVLIPAALRRHAKLKREALWAGMGKHIEVWSKERFDALRDEALADEVEKQAIVSRLAELGL